VSTSFAGLKLLGGVRLDSGEEHGELGGDSDIPNDAGLGWCPGL
jgi:hypothetical protein